jgi:hemoglobin/transferrin/lactoferrin receptor protein
VALFRNRYEDFIETRAPLGPDPATGTLLFQSVNRDRVRIEGAELRLRQRLGAGFSTELAAEWLRGRDTRTGRSLPQIPPPKAIVSVDYAPGPDWELRLVTTVAGSQRRLRDAAGNEQFSTPGYATVDLIGRWSPRHDLSLGVGLFNLADRRYWRASGVTGRSPADPTLPLLAEPGRSLRADLSWRF